MKPTLKNLIAGGNTRQVIEILLRETTSLSNTDLHKEVISQSAFYSRYKHQQLSGIYTEEQDRIEIAKINRALLTIIDQLPDNSNSIDRKVIDNLGKVKENWLRWTLIIGSSIGILVVLTGLSGYSLRDLYSKTIEKKALNLTIKCRDINGNRLLKGDGYLVIDYQVKTENRQINEQGNVDLRGISVPIGTPISIKLEAKGYTEEYVDSIYKISEESILFYIKSSCSNCKVFGNIRNQTAYIKNATVQISGFKVADTTDLNGFFELIVPPELEQEEYPVTVIIDNKIVWENYISPNPNVASEILIQ